MIVSRLRVAGGVDPYESGGKAAEGPELVIPSAAEGSDRMDP